MSALNQPQFPESQPSDLQHPLYPEHEPRKVYPWPKHTVIAEPSLTFTYKIVKRCTDIVLALLIIPLLLPVFALIALALKADSPGPVFFSHRRIRKTGSYFGMWKFRTMCVDADSVLEAHLRDNPSAMHEWQSTQKLRNDPRITRFGCFLRRTSLDELPQIWNVLNGTMSLVGPRPIVDAEVPRYGDHFACYMRVKPGITGLWQVSGRCTVSYDTRVGLDCSYVQKWSLWSDFVILAKTIFAVFRGEGAF